MCIFSSKYTRRKNFSIIAVFIFYLLITPLTGGAAESNTQKDLSTKDLSEIYYKKGNDLLVSHQYESALVLFKRAISLNQGVGRYYSAKAGALLGLGKKKEAILDYQQALKLEPQNKEFQQGLKNISEPQQVKSGITDIKMKPGANGEETPSSMVKHNNFFIDRMEVSISQFQNAFPEYQIPKGFTPSMPVVNVNYQQAVDYAKRKNKRLCTSEEWQIILNEYGDGTIEHDNLYKDYHGGPYQVDNAPGEVKNLVGNVAEWVGDNHEKPGYIGGHWFSATLLQDSMDQVKQVNATEKGEATPFVGFRCCRDVW